MKIFKHYFPITVLILIFASNGINGQDNPEELLLNNFRPVSIYKIPETRISEAKYPVIDMHSHPYPKSIEALNNWVKTMDAAGIDKTVIMTYTTGAEFDSLFRVYSRYPDRFI